MARGRVIQGFLKSGERIVTYPIGDPATVSRVEHLQPPSDQADRLQYAQAGDTVDLVLSGIELIRMSVGNILANQNALPPITKRFKARIIVMDTLTIPLIQGAQVVFHMQSLDVPAVLKKLIATTTRSGEIKKERPRALTKGTTAIVEVLLSDKVCMEPYSDCRSMGRFVLRRAGDTVAIGIIEELL